MEGQMDVIRASTIGINNCIATMGTALTKDHKNIIKNMTNNIVLCFDGDEAGEKATVNAIELLEDTNIDIKVVRLPNNMDPDEYILKEGKDSFFAQIKNAINLIDYKMELLKKNKDFGNIKDVSSYINSVLKELINEKDDITIELINVIRSQLIAIMPNCITDMQSKLFFSNEINVYIPRNRRDDRLWTYDCQSEKYFVGSRSSNRYFCHICRRNFTSFHSIGSGCNRYYRRCGRTYGNLRHDQDCAGCASYYSNSGFSALNFVNSSSLSLQRLIY